LLKNLKREYLRRELWVPLCKTDDKIQVIVDDPNNILKRDMIESLLKTKAVKYDVAFPEDIIGISTTSFRCLQMNPPFRTSRQAGRRRRNAGRRR
jgi:hypothetical protein